MWKEIRHIKKVYKVTKQVDEILRQENKIEVNWIGEPYFIIKVPGEFWESDQTLNSYVWKSINDKNIVFQKLEIDDILYPIISVDRKNKVVLVELVTKKQRLKFFWKSIKTIVFLTLLAIALRYGYLHFFVNK